MNYSVSRRTREIGIRIALGAPADGVQWLIVRQGMVLAAVGMVLGLGAAWGVARFSDSILYGVPVHDLVTFIGVPVFLGAVALVGLLDSGAAGGAGGSGSCFAVGARGALPFGQWGTG
jgi:ABC-type antimicrobial peptide transport system permease subunit